MVIEAEVIPATTAAQIGGAALLFGALGNMATVIMKPGSAGPDPVGIWLTILILVLAIVAFVLPWDQFGPRSTLLLVPGAFAFIGFGNYTDPSPYVAGVYFILVGAWTGLCHPRFITLKLAPFFALFFWAPLYMVPHLDRLGISTAVITVVSVFIGESLGTLRTSLEESRRQLTESTERRLAALTRDSVDVTFVFGPDNTIRHVSPSVRARFGYAVEDITAMPLDEFLTTKVEGLSAETIEALLMGTYVADEGDTAKEFRLQHRSGVWIDIEAAAQNMVEDDDIGGILVHVRDVTGRKVLEADLQHKAFHDDLTGLANRGAFRKEVRKLVDRGKTVSVIFIDLDGFKSVNDTGGHKQGDRLLQLAAERILAVAPTHAVVARLGGDEFAIALQLPVHSAASLAELLVARLSESYTIDGVAVTIGASAGVSASDVFADGDRLISDADTAMYEAKSSEASQVVVFDPAMRSRRLEQIELRSRLRKAISDEEFVLHFQPAVDLVTGSWVGVESLVRWEQPGIGLVPPGAFIGAAENSGLIVELGRWILNEACREAASWPAERSDTWIAVNVSPRQFRDPGLLTDIESAVASSGLEPHRLVIEITESVLMEDIEAAGERLNALRHMGIRLAIDDFGTGYSSLAYLQSLPFDILKIDRSFVIEATTEPSHLKLLTMINRLGHDLGLVTLIEGIETPEQAKLVEGIHVDLAQGYYFARPAQSHDLGLCRQSLDVLADQAG